MFISSKLHFIMKKKVWTYDKVDLCRSGHPGTHTVDQVGLDRHSLSLPPRVSIQGVSQHHWVYFCFLVLFVDMQVHGPWCKCGGQRTTLESGFFSFSCGGTVSHFGCCTAHSRLAHPCASG